jgi:hypothetical protein
MTMTMMMTTTTMMLMDNPATALTNTTGIRYPHDLCWGKLPKFLVNRLPMWTEFHGSTSSPRPEHSENNGQKRHAVEAVAQDGGLFFQRREVAMSYLDPAPNVK